MIHVLISDIASGNAEFERSGKSLPEIFYNLLGPDRKFEIRDGGVYCYSKDGTLDKIPTYVFECFAPDISEYSEGYMAALEWVMDMVLPKIRDEYEFTRIGTMLQMQFDEILFEAEAKE